MQSGGDNHTSLDCIILHGERESVDSTLSLTEPTHEIPLLKYHYRYKDTIFYAQKGTIYFIKNFMNKCVHMEVRVENMSF